MTMTNNWLEVDRAGLAQVIADRPKSFLLYELVQNALDEHGVTSIDVTIEMHPTTRGHAIVTVVDDSDNGYADIRHAWTLYAPSGKKSNPMLRGRYNVGCKMVLALAVDASIVSTQSGVRFGKQGRQMIRQRTDTGTRFCGTFRLSRLDADEAIDDLRRIIPPDGISIRVNGDLIPHRTSIVTATVVGLATVMSGPDGVLRRTARKTLIDLYEPCDGEVPSLYEMGIPVVELDGNDPWHIDVHQRVPLNQDRDNVTPSYLRQLRVAALNAGHDRITGEQSSAVWITEASEDKRAEPKAVAKVLDERFGQKRVAFDPSDLEANARAVAAGYTVVPGRSLTAGQWANARRDGAIRPAGQVTPSQTTRQAPDGVPPLPREQWAPAMREIAEWAEFLGTLLEVVEDGEVTVEWYGSADLPFAGAWKRGFGLLLNRWNLRTQISAWASGNRQPICRLLIHEFAHEFEANHLSDRFAEECIRLAVSLAFAGISGEWE